MYPSGSAATGIRVVGGNGASQHPPLRQVARPSHDAPGAFVHECDTAATSNSNDGMSCLAFRRYLDEVPGYVLHGRDDCAVGPTVLEAT